MPPLEEFPNEILSDILTYVYDANHSSIFSVVLVNKNFNRIASPLLVRHWSDEGYYGHHVGHPPCLALSKLALELIRHPEYRSQVKTLSFSWFQRTGGPDAAHVPLEPEDLQKLALAAKEVVPTLAGSTHLCDWILEGRDDAIAVLVLAWATNLTSLSISVPYFFPTPGGHDESPLVLRFAKQLALRFVSEDLRPSTPLPLAKLNDLEFRYGDTKDLLPFLYLPNLKNLHTYSLSGPGRVQRYIQDEYGIPLPEGTSSIESIILEEPTLSGNGIRGLLKVPKSLKAFKYELCSNVMYARRRNTALASGIRGHAASLEKLDLSDSVSTPNHALGLGGEIYLRDCYRHLTNVKRLSIRLLDLYSEVVGGEGALEYNPHVLPDSIEHLKLYYKHLHCRWQSLPNNQILDSMAAVVAVINAAGPQGRFKNLKTVDCSQAVFDDPKFEEIREMKELAQEQGVTLLLRAYVTHNGSLSTGE
ncbi:hypothetical protein IL306_008022 [Fusarium sp. DS 682]|nr:hypothetical protein IL306_008022 [Fusarium sp. DS 682]